MPAIGTDVLRLLSHAAVAGRRAAVSVAAAFAALLVLVALLYATAPWYDLSPSAPFAGPQWYNPYHPDSASGARWLKANFHAHSRAWGGTTDGRQDPHAVLGAYAALGYDIIGLSNYHALPHDTTAFPVFEHGWNVWKSHRLALGARRVVWRDYPLGQLVQHKQDMIRRLREAGALVAIAHPAMRHGHSPHDLARLSGYDAIEVLNHYLPPAEAEWDTALSHGRAAWILANDDSHDVTGVGETGVHWTLVHAASTRTESVLAAIRDGRTIGVRGTGGQTALRFHDQRLRGDTLEVRVSGPVRAIEFIGQGGALRRVVPREALERHGDTLRATAVAAPSDGYLRAVVLGDESSAHHMLGSALFLNPVLRWDGRSLGVSPATVNGPRTLLARVLLLVSGAALLTPALRARLRRRRRVPAPAVA